MSWVFEALSRLRGLDGLKIIVEDTNECVLVRFVSEDVVREVTLWKALLADAPEDALFRVLQSAVN